MKPGNKLPAVIVGLALSAALAGCGALSLTNVLNPDLLTSAGLGQKVATLPGEAPGLRVSVENRTGLWVQMVVAYRDNQDTVQNYTTTLAPGDSSSQMLVCPVSEITLGDLSNLRQSGALVYLTSAGSSGQNLAALPYVEVDPFGVLMRTGVNYDCGDEVRFAVQPSSVAQSGFQIFGYVRRSGATQ